MHFPLLVFFTSFLMACATSLPQTTELEKQGDSLATGRVVTVITGERTRMFLPELRMFELVKQENGERFSVELEPEAHSFSVSLAPGKYQVTRIQISEGPFLSMAQVELSFAIESGGVTDLGTWRFGVDSPRYGRMVALSIVDGEQEQGIENLSAISQHSDPQLEPTKRVMPQPAESQARLYEVMPYPRYSQYFRRHLW